VDFAEAVAIFVTRIFATSVADCLVLVAPSLQTGVDAVLIGMDERPQRDSRLEDRMDRFLLNIFQQLQNDVAAALNQAEDRRLFFLQRAPARGSFEPTAPSGAAFLATAAGLPLCPATT
jgi:hypothetical protein